jgi:hypothetical protein
MKFSDCLIFSYLERLSKKIDTDSKIPGKIIYLIAAERFAKSAVLGPAQKMLAQYIASLGADKVTIK